MRRYEAIKNNPKWVEAMAFDINYIDSIILQNNKNYSINIVHGMRDNNLNGVETIGVEIN